MSRLAVVPLAFLILGCGDRKKVEPDETAPAKPTALPAPPAPDARPAPPALPDPDGPDTAEHNKQLEDACHGGNGEACYYIASRIHRGVGVGDTPLEEFDRLSPPWYQKGCDLNDAWSCEKLGVALLLGLGITKDEAKGVELAQKACTTSAARCGLLARMHFAGMGVAKDPARGLELLDKACADKDPDSCGELASRLMDGKDVKADPARAVSIATEACTANERACWALGDFTIAGKGGITADAAKGAQLRRAACLSGGRAGC